MNRKAFSKVVLACAATVLAAGIGLADELAFFSPIAGSNPGITIAGVGSAGAPWTVGHGTAVVTDEGRIRVDLRGLILPSTGNAGPVTQVSASVACSDKVVATTNAVNLTTSGNAEIRAKLSLPSPCLGTVVLIRIAALNNSPLANGPFIAATGLVKDANDNDANDNDENRRGRDN